ncbi:MAG: hypothetical protein JWO65_1451, partial [Sphingomonas bacterium]|nr:hypothetical protein [Sphingomonas bacterium]
MEEDEQAGERRGRGRIGVALGVSGGLVLIALSAGWIERRPIVRHFAERELAARHVPATYRITALGPFAQRLEDVTIGDPADPDLVARIVDLRLDYGLGGPHLVAVGVEGVQLKARVVDGRVSLGAIDRLLPASSGSGPIALPDMVVTIADTRVALVTPAGAIAATVTGSGNLSNGFRGHLAATSDRLALGGCILSRPSAAIDVRIADRRPNVRGPIALAGLTCGAGLKADAGRANVDLAFASSLDHWQGGLTLAGFAGTASGGRFGALSGTIGIKGDARRMGGSVDLGTDGIAAAAGKAQRASVTGLYRYEGGAGLIFAGQVALDHAALAEDRRRRLTQAARGLAGTPVGPLATQAVAAGDLLLEDAEARATIAFAAGGPGGVSARVRRLDLSGAGGAHVTLDGGNGVGWTKRGLRVDGRLTTGGGGLPVLDVALSQVAPGAPVSGVARLDPYAAKDARLALTPVRFTVAADGGTRFDTVATLDGPIASGRIEGLSVPIAGRIDGRGGVVLGEGCVPIGFRSLRILGVVLDPARLRACGIGGAPIVSGRRVGLTLADARITGRSGAAPLAIGARAMRLAASGIAVEGLSVRLGASEAETRLDVTSFAGKASGADFSGTFTDAAGQIGHVPLLLSDGASDWKLGGGVLALTATMTVADADPAPRFLPLAARDVALRLVGGKIAASGTLHEPRTGALVLTVAIIHVLSSGQGGATLDVP